MNYTNHGHVVRIRLCVPFLRAVLSTNVEESVRGMVAESTTKWLYLHHQGEFQYQNCTVGSLHDSDHDGVGRFFVGHSEVVKH